MRILITGAAGFIGYHTARRLLSRDVEVAGIDNLNAYYDPALKLARLALLEAVPGFHFEKCDLADRICVRELFRKYRPCTVVHLGAQAGVRYSLEAPFAYADSNLTGFLTVLEGCRETGVDHLVYASSSSVYGNAQRPPSKIGDDADHPLSLYAATKRANEMMAHAYAHLYGIPVKGLRFFTVYGPWGRPDMAPSLFADAILNRRPVRLFNAWLKRDFTYVDDIVEGIERLLPRPPTGRPKYALYNIGNDSPVKLLDFVETLEHCLGETSPKTFLPMQPGDVYETAADPSGLEAITGFRPRTPLAEGLSAFCVWYREYYGYRSPSVCFTMAELARMPDCNEII
jgi:UDP-glucuronate 4-epimerase